MEKVYLIDLDGTMYRGTQIIESAKLFLDWCLEKGKSFLFLTNNSCRTPQQAADHMLRMGYRGIRPEHFYTSAMAAADTVAKRSAKRRAWYIGEEGMREALVKKGFILDSNHPDFLFVGLNRQAGYPQYSEAIRLVLNGAQLIGTNNDRILLSETGANVGNGSVVALFEYCTSVSAMKIGKPYAPILEGALQFLQKQAKDAVMIGDNLETDILCGIRGGVETVLVTTGVHRKEDIERLQIFPDHVVSGLDELIG